MRIKCFLLTIVMCVSLIIPVQAAENFFTLSVSATGEAQMFGVTDREGLVTLRCLFFGEEQPVLPEDIEAYEVTNESLERGTVSMTYMNVVETVNRKYSFRCSFADYGYYLLTAVSDSGQRKSQLYCYEKAVYEEQRNTPEEYIFEVAGKQFVLLDMNREEAKIFPVSDYGACTGSTLSEYLSDIPEVLPAEMTEYITDVSLPTEQDMNGTGQIGFADGVGYFNHEIWEVLTNPLHNRYISSYQPGSVTEKADGVYLENLCLNQGVELKQQLLEKETIIAFTAPESGNAQIKLKTFGQTDTQFQLTALTDKRLFDNRSLLNHVASDAVNLQTEVSLTAGDKLYLHIYPNSADVAMQYAITLGGREYVFGNGIEGANAIWLKEGDEVSRNVYLLDTACSERISAFPVAQKAFVRPVITVESRFFAEEKLDVLKLGDALKKAIQRVFSMTELSAYTKAEQKIIFDEDVRLVFDEAVLTDGEGSVTSRMTVLNPMKKDTEFVMAVAQYSGENKLEAIAFQTYEIFAHEKDDFSVTLKLKDIADATVLKTFLWDDLSPIGKRVISNPSLANTSDSAGWKFYRKPSEQSEFSAFTQQEVIGNGRFYAGGQTLPFAWWDQNSGKFYMRPTNGTDLVVGYEIPENGNWELDLSCRNIGLDVWGGDGGTLQVSCIPAGMTEMQIMERMTVNASAQNPTVSSMKKVYRLHRGDRLLLSANAGVDGYADQWEVCYTVRESFERGTEVVGFYNDLPIMEGEVGKPSGASVDKTVWIGIDASFAGSPGMEEKLAYLEKYLPSFGLFAGGSDAERIENPALFEEKDIPVILQSYGQGLTEYIEKYGGWEWDWSNLILNNPASIHTLSGTAHAFAKPHYATKEAFSRMIRSASQGGLSGFGYPDYVWMYGHRGKTGYNPETVRAFIDDLMGRDSGLRCDDGHYSFRDYYQYYMGQNCMIQPTDFGFATWEEYLPLSQRNYNQMVAQGQDTTHHWVLLDFLCHYEWLKFAQYLGDVGVDMGMVTQIMPNAEYFANGVDFKFLNKLENVKFTEDEFFGNTDYLDGAYYRHKTITQNEGTEKRAGVVMEAGGGGNAGAYYSDEIAYLAAFELGALSYLTHLEADFMYQNVGFNRERDGQIMSYCMGFQDAKQFQLDKRAADFIVVSARNHLRPWAVDQGWYPWDLRLSFDENREFALAKMGYNFESISQEEIKNIDRENVVVFSPHLVTEGMWKEFLSKIKAGSVKAGVISPFRLQNCVTDEFTTEDFSNIALTYSYDTYSASGSGAIYDKSGACISDRAYTLPASLAQKKPIDTTVLSIKSGTKSYPILVKRTVGEGEMYILLFEDSNEYAALSEVVYDYILGSYQIQPMFESVQNTGTLPSGYTASGTYQNQILSDIGASVRVYEGEEMTVVGVQNSMGRYQVSTTKTSTGISIPYQIAGTTEVRVLVEPEKQYQYIAIPSMKEGTVTSDGDGYVNLTFTDSSHELFFLLPAGNTQAIEKIRTMQTTWRTALEELE